MHVPELLLALILMASLTFYVLLGGADYGGGVWDLLSSGPRRQQQRELIANAITPVWEANHVWLILAVVLLFAGFPAAFAAITTALNIPLTVLIVGIVMRGSSFVFRAYQTGDYRTQRHWGVIFAIASIVAPVCLGVVVGAISSGRVLIKNAVSVNGFLAPWLGTFPLIVGLFALSLFVFLAAVYLTVEAREPALQEDFRSKALISGVIVAVIALATFLAARTGAPAIYSGLLRPSLVWIVQGATAAYAIAAFIALLNRKYKVARVAAMLQVGLILWGWGLSQFPFFLQGDMTISAAAAAPPVLWALIGATTAGLLVLFPSIWYLMQLFKARNDDIPHTSEPFPSVIDGSGRNTMSVMKGPTAADAGHSGKSPQVDISLDGTAVAASEGELLVEAILRNKEIPHICYHSPLMGAIQTCDTCIVEVDGQLVRSCGAKVVPNMTVVTESRRAKDARSEAFDVILGNHMLYCTVCDNNNENCRVHNTALALNVQHQEHPFKPKPYEVDMSNPFYRYDPSQCILCGQCVQACQTVEVNETLSIGWELEHPRVLWDGGMQIGGSSCVSCGHCITVCPCNALMEKSMLGEAGFLSSMSKESLNKMIDVVKAVEPEMGYGAIMQVSQTEAKMREERIKKTKTVCTYCGVGCSYDVWTKDRKILKIAPLHGDANQISTCVKGKFGWDYVNHKDRLQKPLIREGSGFREASWEEALTLVTSKLSAIRQQYGPDSLAVIVSSKCTNEDGYLMQKFARAVLGTNNVDNCSRYCQSPATMGLFRTVGYGGDSGGIENIAKSGLVLIIGSQTADSHPVLATRVKRAHKLHGQRLIVADPREHEMAARADIHFRPRPGTDLVWISAMSRYMLDNGHARLDFLDKWVNGLDEYRRSLEPFTMEYAARTCSVPLETLERVARELAAAKSIAILWAMGITQHTHASDGSTAISNLLLITGNYMRDEGGAYPLRGHNNVQGAGDIGAAPNVYPGYQSVTDPEIRSKFEKGWGVALPPNQGMDNHQMVDAVYEGKLRAMYLAGEDMISADSNANHVAGAFEKLDFFVVQDIFFSETCRYADVVLPGAPALEKDGTFSSTERRIQRLYQALPELGDSRADWKITQDIANRMGAKWNYQHPSEIMAEMASLTPLYEGVSYDRLEGYKTLQWPVAADGTDQPVLYLNGFPFPDSKARLYPLVFHEPQEPPDSDFDLFLNNGRLLEHFHEGNMTYRVSGIQEETPERYLEVSVELAKERGIESGRWLRVTSRHGSLVIKALVSNRVFGKQAYLPHLSREGPINILTGSHADVATDTPAFKETAVRIKVLPEQGANPLHPLNPRFSGKPTPQTGVEVERKWKRKDYRMPGTQDLVQIQTGR